MPKHIKNGVMQFAKRDGVSANQFIAVAVAEKLGAMKAEDYFTNIAEKTDIERFLTIQKRKNGLPPQPDDVIPPKLAKRMKEKQA
ncbi:MAG: pilus assembly protein HicB [Burkholderiales bacterium]|nr:pilus assembly protein HicB [Burkholderiales bacterium]